MTMPFARIATLCTLAVVVAAQGLVAQDLGTDMSRYRAFRLGSSLSAVSSDAGIPSTEATLLHQRPAMLQDLTWRLSRWISGAPSTDPVSQIRFSFYNDQLFRLVAEYASDRTQGMTDADLIDAFSASYGRPLVRAVAGVTEPDMEGGTPVARWGDTAHGLIIYRAASYGAPMRLVLTDIRLEGLARRARSESQRLDDLEAPRRELARQKQERTDSANAAEKARETNKAAFKP